MLRPTWQRHWNDGQQGETSPNGLFEVNEAFQFIQINRLIVLFF